MSKTITKPTRAKLKEYHKELQQREWQERKDKCILLTLAVAGLLGVYALVLNGVEQNNLTKSAPQDTEQEMEQNSAKASVRSLR